MARTTISLIALNIILLAVVTLAAPAEKEIEAKRPITHEKEDLIAPTDDLKPAASHWGGHWGGWGGHWGGHYGGYYPYYGSYWGGYPSWGYGYGLGGYPGYGGYYGHHGYWW